MSIVACPHCGFHNFALAPYCGRCERPLPAVARDSPPEVIHQAPPAAPVHVGRAVAIASVPRLWLSHVLDLTLLCGVSLGVTRLFDAQAADLMSLLQPVLVITAVLGTLQTLLLPRSAGAWLTGICVVKESLTALSPVQRVARSLLANVSAALFGAGFFWAILDRKHRSLHDIATRVVWVRTSAAA